MAEQLYAVAAEYAGLRGHERVFDLYCGIGTIGLALAARAREVVGVEIVEPAVADAIENARINEIDNARFYAGDIRLAMRDAGRAGRPPGRRRGRPAARRPVAEDRAPDRRGGAEADRLRLLQPDDAGAERRASSSRPATGWCTSARSTCSRRRRTSSASRCSRRSSVLMH